MLDTAPALRRLLVVDPCEACHRLLPGLRAAGWDVDSQGLDSAAQNPCDVGLLRLQPAHLEHPEIVRDLISRSGTEWIAVLSPEILRVQGIADFVCEWFFDFHTLPFDVTRVQVTLGRAFGMARLRGNGSVGSKKTEAVHPLIGESRAIRDLRRLLGKLAPTESPVLIRGESGTGKELVARTLHAQSNRKGQAFFTFNCAALPAEHVATELFGQDRDPLDGTRQRRVGRIEAASGGTLFLDEVSALPLDVQATLLNVLKEKQLKRVGGSNLVPVDIRVLAASHSDIEADIRSGKLREDLYYRLNVLQVLTTPLRERASDLPLLANHFAQLYSAETGRRARRFSEDALAALAEHNWPGNVNELANRVRRGLVLAEGRQIEAADLGLESQGDKKVPTMGTLEDYKDIAERQALSDVLNRHGDNLSVAAKVLGISRPTFYRLLHKHQVR